MRLLVVAIFVTLAGCVMTGTYVTARTPAKGSLHYGVVTRLAGGHDAIPLPQPDFYASYSPTDDVAVNLRALVFSFGTEALARWRFVHTDHVHLAFAPSVAVAYWPSSKGEEEEQSFTELGAGMNMLARGSLLASIDFGDGDLDLAGFGGISRITQVAVPAGDDAPYAFFTYDMQGTVAVTGGAIGLSAPTKTGRFHASVELLRFAARERKPGPDAPMTFDPRNVYTVTLAWEY